MLGTESEADVINILKWIGTGMLGAMALCAVLAALSLVVYLWVYVGWLAGLEAVLSFAAWIICGWLLADVIWLLLERREYG